MDNLESIQAYQMDDCCSKGKCPVCNPTEEEEEIMEHDRKGWVGGSDAAAAMGVSRWTSPLQLWAEKTGKVEPKDLSDIEAVELGTELEDFVAKKFERKTGMKVRRAPKDYQHKVYDFMRCQVDRLVEGTDELLEVKTCSAWKAKEWEGEEIPGEYIIQVMYQLLITGRSVGWIACLIGGQKFVYKKIEFEQTLADKIEQGVIAFWEMVKEGTPPMAVGDDNDFIAQLYPKSDDQIQAIEEMNDSIALLQQTKNDIGEFIKTKDELEAKLKAVIADSLGIKTTRYVCTWKPQETTRVDSKALKGGDPEIFNKYSRTTKSRVLRVRLNKKEEEL